MENAWVNLRRRTVVRMSGRGRAVQLSSVQAEIRISRTFDPKRSQNWSGSWHGGKDERTSMAGARFRTTMPVHQSGDNPYYKKMTGWNRHHGVVRRVDKRRKALTNRPGAVFRWAAGVVD